MDPRELPAIKVLLYGDVDLNIMDGSAVWLQSMTEALVKAGCSVDVLLKASVITNRILGEIQKLPNLRVINDFPDNSAVQKKHTPRSASQRIVEMDSSGRYDVVVTRGFKIARLLAGSRRLTGRLWPYITDYPQAAKDITQPFIDEMSDIATESARVFVQTEDARSFLEYHVPSLAGKAVLLPPMIPDSIRPSEGQKVWSGELKAVYSGKFAKLWRTDAMCELPTKLRSSGYLFSLTMVGDKIQREPTDPEWVNHMTDALSRPGVDWAGGMSRDEALARVAVADVGLSWRDPKLDASHEISTKTLEYIALGVPPILNNTAAHVELLGEDYPLFVSDDTIVDRLAEVVAHPSLLDHARRACLAAVEHHRVSAVANYLSRLFDAYGPATQVQSDLPLRVLVASHDLKFAADIIAEWRRQKQVSLTFDRWQTLHTHDVAQSRAKLDDADIVFCEWAGPNAVWYSREKRARQKLVVRLHMFELGGPWLHDINWDAVDALVVVSEYYRKLVLEAVPIAASKVLVIPNSIDKLDLARPKIAGAEYHLGLVGTVPLRKRFDRALDLLELLLERDSRFTLHIRGRMPQEYPWEWRKPVVREFYMEQFQRAFVRAPLRGHVAWDYFGPDMASWLRRIGWVLSPSTDESFHLAPMEGAGSGAVPVIWDREGAPDIFGERWLKRDAAEAADFISNAIRHETAYAEEREAALRHASEFDVSRVMPAWRSVLSPSSP